MARGRLDSPANGINLAIVLALVAVVAIAVAGFGLVREVSSPFAGVERETEIVFPELSERADDIATVVIDVDAETVTFEREGGGWTIPEKDGYPADGAMVDKVLAEFATMPAIERLELGQGRTAEELGVPDRDAEEAGRYVRLIDGDGDLVKSFIVGRKRSAPGAENLTAFYLREEGSDVVWLADAELAISADPLDWLDQQIMALPREHIAEVRAAPPGGEPVHIRREGPGEAVFHGVNLPEGTELEGPWILSELVVPFTAMNFEDVAAAPEPLEPGGESEGFVRTFGGVRIWFVVDQAGEDEYWVRFAVEEVEAAPGWRPEDAAQEEPADEAEQDFVERPVEPVMTAEELRAQLAPWTFRVPDYTAMRLRRSIDDLATLGDSTAQER